MVIEVEAFPGEDKAGIMFSLQTLYEKLYLGKKHGPDCKEYQNV